jgi:hypothetical protein
MDRRRFLQSAAATAGLLALPRGASAQGWGAGSSAAHDLLLPAGTRAERVLELFLNGGMGQFETFYVVEEHGRPEDPNYPNQQWYLFDDVKDAYYRDLCGIERDDWLQYFGLDAAGRRVNFGPLVMPLRQRPDVLSRTRVIVRQHDSPIHVVAVPFVLTGRHRGDVLMASQGAHVQRHFLEREGGSRLAPYSYVLYPENTSDALFGRPSVATGLHPGSARPLYMQVRSGSAIVDQLARNTLGSRSHAFDRLVSRHAEELRRRYEGGSIQRSPVLDDFDAELLSVQNAPALRQILDPSLFTLDHVETCGYAGEDPVAPLMRAGVHLLTHPVLPARHVTLINNALGDEIWDPHFGHMAHQTTNWPHTLQLLMDLINEPGENDPRKLNLDDTMIVINSDFGRSPTKQADTIEGTNHWPHGYVSLMIGGPIGEDQAGVVGAIGPNAVATDFISTLDERAAVLAAMGIYPFEREAFNLGEVQGLSNPADGVAYLNEVVLGRRP